MRIPTATCKTGKSGEKKKVVMVGTGTGTVDKEVRVLDFGAMRKGWERRVGVQQEEVGADLRLIRGLGDMLGDFQYSTSSSSSGSGSASETEAGAVSDAVLGSTPPTPWMDGAAGSRQLDRSARAGHLERRLGLESSGKEKGKQKQRQEDSTTDRQKPTNAPPVTPAVSASSHQQRRSRIYDQDEMVNRELAFLPPKRSRKPRERFAGAGPQATTTSQQKVEERSAGPSRIAAGERNPSAKRKREDGGGAAAISRPVPRTVAGSRLLGRRSPADGRLRSLQDALEEAGLTDGAIARRAEKGAGDSDDSPYTRMSVLMERRDRFINEWQGRLPAMEERRMAVERLPGLAKRVEKSR